MEHGLCLGQFPLNGGKVTGEHWAVSIQPLLQCGPDTVSGDGLNRIESGDLASSPMEQEGRHLSSESNGVKWVKKSPLVCTQLHSLRLESQFGATH